MNAAREQLLPRPSLPDEQHRDAAARSHLCRECDRIANRGTLANDEGAPAVLCGIIRAILNSHAVPCTPGVSRGTEETRVAKRPPESSSGGISWRRGKGAPSHPFLRVYAPVTC